MFSVSKIREIELWRFRLGFCGELNPRSETFCGRDKCFVNRGLSVFFPPTERSHFKEINRIGGIIGQFCMYSPIMMKEEVTLIGFPAYSPGQGYFMADSKVAKFYTQSTVHKFEIDQMIREVNSGGPILNSDFQVIGMAVEGASKESGNNGCIFISEIQNIISSDGYKI